MDPREKSYLTDIRKELAEYLDIRLEVIKLKTFEKTSTIASSLVSGLILVFLLLFFTLFLFVTLGFYFSSLLGSYTSGFGIITGFYLALVLIFLAVRKKVFEKFLTNKIVEALTDDEETIS